MVLPIQSSNHHRQTIFQWLCIILAEVHKNCSNQSGGQTSRKTCCVVQSLSNVHLFVTPCTAARQASLTFTISWHLCQLLSVESVMPSNHFILCYPLLPLPSIFPSIRVFSSESVLHVRWLKYWSFSISPSSKYSGLISFTIDWFDLFAVQGTLKSLLHHQGLKASILWCSSLFMVQLSHLYTTTGKTITLILWTFVAK